jgi:hypothetical protein
MVLGGLMVVLLLGLVGCGDDGDDGDDSVLGASRARAADLTINDELPFYDKKTLEMPLNREVTFTVHNEGKELHNITIPGFTIDMDIPAGQTVEIKLPAITAAPRDGFYLMYCKYHQHEGEAGRITIAD